MPLFECTLLTTEYVAGFFDGEGSIGIYASGHRHYHLRTQVTQNITEFSEPLFTALLGTYGGSLGLMAGQPRTPAYNWQLSGDKATAFLTEIEPALRLKRQQPQLAIAWQRQRPPVCRNARGQIVRTEPHVLSFDRKVYSLMGALKRGAMDQVMLDRPYLVEVVRALEASWAAQGTPTTRQLTRKALPRGGDRIIPVPLERVAYP